MKTKVIWVDWTIEPPVEHSVSGTLDYDPGSLFETAQAVVDTWEALGITIDQGGDDDWHELTLVDWDGSDPQQGARLLAEIEARGP